MAVAIVHLLTLSCLNNRMDPNKDHQKRSQSVQETRALAKYLVGKGQDEIQCLTPPQIMIIT